MFPEAWGIFCIGLVFGWLLYYAVRHTENFSVATLSPTLGVVGSAATIGWIQHGATAWIGPYGVGVGIGFFGYFLITVCLVFLGKLDAVDQAKLLLAQEKQRTIQATTRPYEPESPH